MEELAPMVTSTHTATHPIRVVVVGAGGTGGRLIPALMQVLRRGDSVAIVDGDHVEDRNLARQNFRTRDVGENKAEVMARRYQREGIRCDAFGAMLSAANWTEIYHGAAPTERLIILGCVDNPAARVLMSQLSQGRSGAIWIDGGNERRGGQVILSSHVWPFKVKALSGANFREHSANWNIEGMKAMPQLLQFQPWHCDRCNVDNMAERRTCVSCNQQEASCQDRIDLQTVAVNQLSATCMLNVLSCILYQVPISTCGAFFSILNTMSPIRLKSVQWDAMKILPETTYANVSTE